MANMTEAQIDKAVAYRKARIDAALQTGLLTEEQHTRLLERLVLWALDEYLHSIDRTQP